MVHFIYIAFFLKHILADFPLQIPYMMQKTNKSGWFLPLLSHSLVHAGLTQFIVLFFTRDFKISFLLGLVDLILHFTVDAIKSRPELLGRFKMMSSAEVAAANENIKIAEAADTMDKSTWAEIQVYKTRVVNSMYAEYALAADLFLHLATYSLIIKLMGF